MATGTLTGQTIANTYKSLLKITGTTAGGETLHSTTQKVIEDGDGNAFPLSVAADAIMITSTNRLEFGDDGTYIHQSADGTLDLVADTILELNGGAGSIKIDANSRISLSNNDSGGTGGQASTSGNTILGYLAGNAISDGDVNNTIIGHESAKLLNDGDNNVAIGTGAMDATTASSDNIAIGRSALGGGNVTNGKAIAIGGDALQALTSGQNNVAIGYQAMSETTGGNYNTAIGYQAMYLDNGMANIHNTFVGQGIASGDWANNPCTHNTGLGSGVMQGNMDGAVGNTALGVDSLNALTSGDYNTALGFNAGASINSGGYNVFVGYNAGDAVNTAAGNVFLGASAGSACTDTANAVLIGNGAGEDADIASDGTIAIGYQSLKPLINGARNVAIGYQSGSYTTGGGDNTLIGYRAGSQGDSYGITTGERNVAVGSHAFGGSASAHITGARNTAVGTEALLNAQEGVADNTAVGQNALYAVTTGTENVAVGSNSGDALTGSENVLVGSGSGGALQAVNGNVAVGRYALNVSTAAADCVAIGRQAMYSGTATAAGTVAIGKNALVSLGSGDKNLAIGYNAMAEIVDGNNNTAVGYGAMQNSVGGTTSDGSSNNTFIGQLSGGGQWANTNSAGNTAVGSETAMSDSWNGASYSSLLGYQAGKAITTGSRNTLVGYASGDSITTGTTNTIVGAEADTSAVSGDNQTVIGYNAVGKADNTFQFGNDSTLAWIFGNAPYHTWSSANNWRSIQLGSTAALSCQNANSAVGQLWLTNNVYYDDASNRFEAQNTGESCALNMNDDGHFNFHVSNGSDNADDEVGLTLALRINNNTNFEVQGALSKGSGSFKIDHPLESKKDTHHLVHSFVESPQANNIYRGKVDLVSGSATINLDTVSNMTDGTFVLLNTDIQCFTSNESNWDNVKGSVSGNTLTISCQNTNSTATISWLVIGERQDKHIMETNWTDENGKVIVEPEKLEE